MDIPQKLTFIHELIDNVKDEIITKVADMPEEWDGIELRWYIKEKFNEVVFGTHATMRSKRGQNYRNFIITKGGNF